MRSLVFSVGRVAHQVVTNRFFILCLAVVGLGMLGTLDVFAQTEEVSFEEIVSFGEIFKTIRVSIGPLVAGAIGLGLAIWGARYVFRIIKSMGR